MGNKQKNLRIYAIFVCLLMVISPLAMAEEMSGDSAAIAEEDNEWQVVWQDETGTVSVENGKPEWIWVVAAIAYWAYTSYDTYNSVKSGDYVGAVVGLIPVGKVVKVGPKGAAIINSLEKAKVGLKTEAAVLSALGKTKNTKTVSATVDGTKVNTIPDYIDNTAKEVGEVKDYSDVLSNIKQIRAQMAYAQEKKYNYVIYLNGCNEGTGMSGPLKNAMKGCKGIKCSCKEISDILEL